MIALKSLARNFWSLLLYSISICIGVTSVFLINSISNYCINSAQLMLDKMGIDGYILSSNLINDKDILTLNTCHCVDYVTPIFNAVSYETNKTEVKCVGGNSQIKDVFSLEISKGEFYDNQDVNLANEVCVIGTGTAQKLFNTDNCIGQKLNININSFSEQLTIIGLYKSDKITSEIDFNEPIYIPYTLISAINNQAVNSILIKTKNTIDANESTNNLKLYCDNLFGKELYNLKNTASEREKINSLMELIKTILEIIVGVSIIVSVFGLMTIMIINIRNKRKEIGLKKALGATDISIIKEVCFESVVIAALGTINGFILYILIRLPVNNPNLILDYKVLVLVPIITIISALIIAIIPSLIAAKINTATALKSDN